MTRIVWALTGHLGTVRDLVRFNSGVNDVEAVVHRTYAGFGYVTSESNPEAVDVLFGFATRLFDRATGLQNNLNRWYDPAVGQWVSEDPVGFAGGDGNLYRYLENSATTQIDPSGLRPPQWDKNNDLEPDTSLTNEALARKLSNIASDTTVPDGKNHCDRWTQAFNGKVWLNLRGKPNVSDTGPVRWDVPFSGRDGGHAAFAVEFVDGTIVYYDNGALGREDHQFTDDDVPWYWTKTNSL